jgi:hypothetical protein
MTDGWPLEATMRQNLSKITIIPGWTPEVRPAGVISARRCIEVDAAAERKHTGREPLGAAAILRQFGEVPVRFGEVPGRENSLPFPRFALLHSPSLPAVRGEAGREGGRGL